MTDYTLPTVGEPRWYGTERDCVCIDGYIYGIEYDGFMDSMITGAANELARWVKARDFAIDQAALAKWDCAGERAFVAWRNSHSNPFSDSWDELSTHARDRWIAVAKAVKSE